jgi:hypothetical protein
MAFQLFPGVLVTERDLTDVVPAVATTAGGYAGHFNWGPVNKVVAVDSERSLTKSHGTPDSSTYESFFTAANFLSYGNNLQVVRAGATAHRNAVAAVNLSNTGGTATIINNQDSYEANASFFAGTIAFDTGIFAAKYPGTWGNSLKISMADANTFSSWTYAAQFDGNPGTSDYASVRGGSLDGLHVIVIDEDGLFSGTPGTVLEKFPYLSKASDAKKSDGSSAYYKDVLRDQSGYVYAIAHPASANLAPGANTAWGTTVVSTTFGNLITAVTSSFVGGALGTPTDGDVTTAYDEFKQDGLYDLSLVPIGSYGANVISYVVNNICEVRKDCVAFFGPPLSNVLNRTSTTVATTAVTGYRDAINLNTSYAVMDSGWKYQYDRYNDTYRWVPLNGDIAGLCARTDFVADPWYSPAGYSRGVIKNVVKLAYSPTLTDRDNLYKKGVNPVVSFPGQGTVLFGDKTQLTKPSAFDRINVRRLFIVLEKAIATAAKYQLFEFNDAFTRAQFRNLVEPFLRDVQGRRGITDFKVVCDETNNTGEVIDRNEFVADIFIKPARSINFITLNFIATRTGIAFEEVGA